MFSPENKLSRREQTHSAQQVAYFPTLGQLVELAGPGLEDPAGQLDLSSHIRFWREKPTSEQYLCLYNLSGPCSRTVRTKSFSLEDRKDFQSNQNNLNGPTDTWRTYEDKHDF